MIHRKNNILSRVIAATLSIISDFYQSKDQYLEFGLQQHQDVWLYQLGEEDWRAEFFAEELESELQSDCSLRLYRKDGVKMAYREDFPYDFHQEAAIVPVPTQDSNIQAPDTEDDKVVVMMVDDTAGFSMKDLMYFIVLILGMIIIYCLASQGINAWRYRRANGADGHTDKAQGVNSIGEEKDDST